MIGRGTLQDFKAAAALTGNPEWVRSRWNMRSFDPARHLWVADAAVGALHAPDEAVLRSKAARVSELLERINEQARIEGVQQLTFVIPGWDEPAWRAYEQCDFTLATEVLEMEVAFDAPPREPSPPVGGKLRADADRVARMRRESRSSRHTRRGTRRAFRSGRTIRSRP